MTKQLLHLVVGGELTDPSSFEFRDLKNVEFVGAYPNYAEAVSAWRGRAQQTVDNALMRFFVIHAHKLIDPEVKAVEDAKRHNEDVAWDNQRAAMFDAWEKRQ